MSHLSKNLTIAADDSLDGIISKNGQILGKMGHTERFEGNLFKNIMDEGLEQPLFDNAVAYFRGE